MKKNNLFTPLNLNIMWNIGSLISIMMTYQIMTGLFISMNYININNPYMNSMNIYLMVNYGWILRIIHSNLTSMLFLLIYCHIMRNIMYNSYKMMKMWLSGMLMFLMMMMISFIGYSLNWTQMSYWGMMVITNFISIIPYIGNTLMIWLWGNFNINFITLNRFFSMHFIMPLIIIIMLMIHLMFLHSYMSSNSIGINKKMDIILLNPFSIIKDFNILIVLLMLFLNLNFIMPFILNNNDNFIMTNFYVTPKQIEPEWYFLFFYSILRTITNKLGGLMIMILSIIMIIMLPLMLNNKFINKLMFINKMMLIIMMMTMIVILKLGMKMIEYPYLNLNMMLIIMFFMLPFIIMLSKKIKF